MTSGLLRVGSRKSALARAQAEWVAARVDGCTALVWVQSEGDRDTSSPLPSFGGVGIFTRALHEALRADRFDAAVHSLKDLPTKQEVGVHLAVVAEREDPRDVLVARDGATLAALPAGARVGTGSPRRVAQLRRVRPDLTFVSIRGNVPTRVKRVDDGTVDAVVLAYAGLRRLGLEGVVTEVLDPQVCLPAAGQGAIGITIREGDASSDKALRPLRDVRTAASTSAERAALHALGAGCHTPMGALATLEDGQLVLRVRLCDVSGARCLDAEVRGVSSDARALGEEAAKALRAQGADELLA